ncbi:MAG TPA: hypothetical protein VMA72_26940 [Streptosporangiaceae bacterium]|nr:hypothetical protein [Streptosporangiaceae bacterium]
MATSCEANTPAKPEHSTLSGGASSSDQGGKNGRGAGMWYGLEVRLTPSDVGKRVVIRWRPGPPDSKQMTDVLGILEQADGTSFAVRTRDGRLVVIPVEQALAGKVVPPAPPAAGQS